MSKLTFIFVHGLSGWGSYDAAYRLMPYWGMRGGDLMARLRGQGFDCHAASVAPTGSAWDRACELYAQISGCSAFHVSFIQRSCLPKAMLLGLKPLFRICVPWYSKEGRFFAGSFPQYR